MSPTPKRRNFLTAPTCPISKFTFRSTKDLLDEVDRLAEAEGVSRTRMLNTLIREAMDGRRKKRG